MLEDHGLILLQSEMEEIVRVVSEAQESNSLKSNVQTINLLELLREDLRVFEIDQYLSLDARTGITICIEQVDRYIKDHLKKKP